MSFVIRRLFIRVRKEELEKAATFILQTDSQCSGDREVIVIHAAFPRASVQFASFAAVAVTRLTNRSFVMQ